MLWYILNGLYLIIWSVLLVDCLHRSKFYPIFGQGWGTKIFWFVTFVLFNPLLSLLYIIFLILLLSPKVNKNSKSTVYGSVAAVAYTCVVLALFHIPLGELKEEPSVILSSSEKSSLKDNNSFLNFRKNIALGFINSENKIQTVSSASPGQNSRVSLRNVALLCQSSHRMLDRVAREFQKSLVKLPYIDEVSYYSYGTFPIQGGILPDVFVTIAMPDIAENKFLHSRKLQALIKCKAGSSMFEGMSNLTSFQNDNPVVQFDITSEIHYDSTMVGIESPDADYLLEAKDISNEITKTVRKQLENLLENYKELPELPDFLFGKYIEPPEFSFLKKEKSELLFSGNGLLKNNCTIWRFQDKRESSEALIDYSNAMKDIGWKEGKRGDDYLYMHKNKERMYIFRQSHRDTIEGPVLKNYLSHTLMIANYESRFSDDHLEEVIDELVKNEVDISTLLIFDKFFKTPHQRKLLCSMIEHDSTSTLNGYLVLGQYWIDKGEVDKAREALMFARAMQLLEKKDSFKAQEIENLAEKIGDESLIEIPLDMNVLCKTGFVNLDEINNEPLVFERGLDEPVLLYRSLENGQLQTLALHVIKSIEPSFSMPYRLLTIEKQQGRSSSSETEGRLGTDRSWIAESSLHDFTVGDEPIQLSIKSFGNERFLFTIIKGQQV